MRHGRIENGMNDDDDEIAEVLTHEEDNDMFKSHGEMQMLGDGTVVLRQTVQQMLVAVNDGNAIEYEHMDLDELYEQFDYADDGERIEYIYSMFCEDGNFSVFTGVQYFDDRIAIVGLNQDGWLESYDEMIRKLRSGL